jgi:hypothetical protein
MNSLHGELHNMNLNYASEFISKKGRNVSFDSYIQAFFQDYKKEEIYDTNLIVPREKHKNCDCVMNLHLYITSPLDTPDGSPDLTRKKIEL